MKINFQKFEITRIKKLVWQDRIGFEAILIPNRRKMEIKKEKKVKKLL